MNSAVILIQCPDQRGLVSKVTSLAFDLGINILDCQQHVDSVSHEFFMRLKLDMDSAPVSTDKLEHDLSALAETLNLSWSIHYSAERARVAILVSKTTHCLYDLLVRQSEGELNCEIPLVIGNHSEMKSVAEQFGIEFHHAPITPDTKAQQEADIEALLDSHRIDVVVLARYMQVLSDEFVSRHANKIINIHHAFLPAFKGAKPYHQAYERGVKIIGATAHYVTSDLDEGPIIEQDVEHVTHEYSPRELQRIGRDIERIVLARAVKAHLEHRVIVTGSRTVVFSTGG